MQWVAGQEGECKRVAAAYDLETYLVVKYRRAEARGFKQPVKQAITALTGIAPCRALPALSVVRMRCYERQFAIRLSASRLRGKYNATSRDLSICPILPGV